MLKCTQAMELEFLAQSMNAATESSPAMAFTSSPAVAKAMRLSTWAYDVLEQHNNKAIDCLEEVYKKEDIHKLRIDTKNKQNYIPEAARALTTHAVNAHKQAFAHVAERVDPILKHGLTPEDGFGKMLSKVMPAKAEAQMQNGASITNLLRAETDIDYVQSDVLYSLQREKTQKEAFEALRHYLTLQYGDIFPSDPLFPKEIAELNEAIIAIPKEIKDMRAEERKMSPAEISLEKGEDGIYTLTVAREKGVKHEFQYEGTDVEYQRTETAKQRKQELVVQLGQESHLVSTEQKTYLASLKSTKEQSMTRVRNSELEQEKRGYKNNNSLGEVRLTKTRSIQGKGKRTTRLQLKILAAKMEHRRVKTHNVGPKTKETELASFALELLSGGASAHTPTKEDLFSPFATIEASPIKATVGLGPLSANFGAGIKLSAGAALSQEESWRKISDFLTRKITPGSPINMVALQEELEQFFQSTNITQSIDWGSFEFSAGDITLLEKTTPSPTPEQYAASRWAYDMNPAAAPTKTNVEIEESYMQMNIERE